MRTAKACMVVVVWVFLMGEASALTGMDSPEATLDQGSLGIGFDYSFGRQDIEVSGPLIQALFGTSPVVAEDVESNRYYGTLSYGLTDWLGVFLKLGTADADYADWGFATANKFSYGYGIKANLYENEKITVGAIGQMHWIKTDKTWYEFGIDWEAEYDAYEVQVAIGPTIDMDGWFLYGGPFYYILKGDITLTALGYDSITADLAEDSSFGGFVGAYMPIHDIIDIGTDFTFTGSGYAIGARIICKL